MEQGNSRIAAIKTLLDDEKSRKVKENWHNIFSDKNLLPDFDSVSFEADMYQLLIVEMEEGYERKEAVKREIRKRSGRAKYAPPPIGRFIFAAFRWHGLKANKPNPKVELESLIDLSSAFGFRIDLAEDELQFLDEGERQKALQKADDKEYNARLRNLIIGGMMITILSVITFLRRRY